MEKASFKWLWCQAGRHRRHVTLPSVSSQAQEDVGWVPAAPGACGPHQHARPGCPWRWRCWAPVCVHILHGKPPAFTVPPVVSHSVPWPVLLPLPDMPSPTRPHPGPTHSPGSSSATAISAEHPPPPHDRALPLSRLRPFSALSGSFLP